VAVGLRRALPAWSFAGKVVLVTGASRGLGLVMARQLAERGARLAICARDAAELERARGELVARGADVLAVTCDVSDPDQAASFVSQAVERYGRVDVLINNAGIIQVGPLEAMARRTSARRWTSTTSASSTPRWRRCRTCAGTGGW
jgi:NAD(P)-dependent dehydrogenase (short-subunit alcohol dehydrogenase family)